jgi:hypothetical protein
MDPEKAGRHNHELFERSFEGKQEDAAHKTSFLDSGERGKVK